MKHKITIGLIILIIVVGIIYFVTKKEAVAPVVTDVKPIELCFAKIGQSNERGYHDEYTLRMLLDGAKVTGELNFFPAEKDTKVGKFEGTVSAVDKTMMARTADVWWNTFGEGMNVVEEQRIIFGEGVANIGFGGTADRGDGVYAYVKNPDIHYTLALNDVACSDLNKDGHIISK